ncbi:MAG: C25 family cysteine peptidase [bacterium]
MKKILSSLTLAIIIHLLPLTLSAGKFTINNGQTDVKYIYAGNLKVSFSSQVSSLQYLEITTKKGLFAEMFIEGCGKSSAIGDPDLPTYRRLIEIPAGADYEIVYASLQYQEYKLSELGIIHPLMPLQPSLSKSVTDPGQVPFVWNEPTYALDQWLGEALVKVTPEGTMRSIHLGSLQISPVQYNPAKQSVRIFTDIQASVVFKNADQSKSLLEKKKFYSPYFGKLYNSIINYDPPADSLILYSPVTFVIVAPPIFKSALKPFIRWKTQKGFRVIEAYTDDPLVGATATSIKTYLHNLYHNPPTGYNPHSFVLIAGDVAQVPPSSNSGQPTDLRYCEYSGDNIPEAFYGRFSAVNTSQLQSYMDKAMEYEKYAFPDETFLGECVMIAGYDGGGNGLTYGNYQINYGTDNYFNLAHNLLSHTYLQPEHSGDNYSQSIRNNVSNGVCYANYTAHGGVDGWSDPAFNNSQVASLNNAHKYPLMVGNCCVTSTYTQNCFGEEITRAVNKGAIGYIGASNNSYWDEDYWWGVGFKTLTQHPPYMAAHQGAYDVTFHDQGQPIEKWFVTQGQMVVGGNLAVQESTSGMKKYYWEIYNLMGDPSLSVYFSIPPAQSASYPGNIAETETSMTVTAEPWAYVALSVNDSILLDAKLVDSTGTVTLTFDAIPSTSQVKIVITKQNRKPIIDSIPIAPFSVLLSIDPKSICTGDTSFLSVEVSGGSGSYTYHWTPSAYLSDSTIADPYAIAPENITYTVQVDDGVNIVTSSPEEITVKERPVTPVIVQEGDSLVSDFAEGNQWYADGIPVAGEIYQFIAPTFSGNYYVIVTDSLYECLSLPSNVIPYYMTAVGDPESQGQVQIYPVPANDHLNILCKLNEPGTLIIRLTDAYGNLVRIVDLPSVPAGTRAVSISCSELAAGIYYCQVSTSTSTIVKKVIITK